MSREQFDSFPFPQRLPCDFGPYRLESVLGDGGMGTVFRARKLTSGFPAAVKVPQWSLLTRDPELAGRLLEEARLAARLAHPNLVKVVDVSAVAGIPYLEMELLEGVGVDQLAGTLSPGALAAVLLGMANGLAHLHAARVWHRDIKPTNVFVTVHGEVKLLDLGIAKALDGGTHDTGTATRGTWAYMAPEHQLGQGTLASDVWSWGVTTYELCVGARLFDGTSAGAVLSQTTVPQERLAEVGAAERLDALLPGGGALVVRALAHAAADRPSAAALAEALGPMGASASALGEAVRGALGGRAAAPEKAPAVDDASVPPPVAKKATPAPPKGTPPRRADAARIVVPPTVGGVTPAPRGPGLWVVLLGTGGLVAAGTALLGVALLVAWELWPSDDPPVEPPVDPHPIVTDPIVTDPGDPGQLAIPEVGARAAAATVAGACGDFERLRMPPLVGFATSSCADREGDESIFLLGSGDPTEACRTLRAWGTRSGFVAETEASPIDFTMLQGTRRLSIQCSGSTSEFPGVVSVAFASAPAE